jgi:lysophospholipase L1-like esterase
VSTSTVFFIILLGVFQPAHAGAAGFTDVGRGHWAYEQIGRLTATGILQGYPDGSFRPDSHVQRQEFAAILARLLAMVKPPAPLPPSPTFVDATERLWSYQYIEAAKAYFPGYITNGSMSFRPKSFATRGEVMSALVEFVGYGVITADLGVLTRFSDVAGLSTQLKIFAALALEENIIAGYSDDTLRLGDPVTRAETSAMLINALAGRSDIAIADPPPPARQLYVPDEDSGFYDAFYDGAVFVGDSVSLGLRNYALYQRGKSLPALGSASFLAEVSYSLKVSSRESFSSAGVNLSYEGEKMALADILSRMGAKKMFIMMGLNDGVADDPSAGIAKYAQTLDIVQKKNPGIAIYVELCTPIAKKGETARLNRANVGAFNEALKAMCAGRGIEWVDTNGPFRDGDNYLRADYTSDNYVHFNNSGAAAWLGALRQFAKCKYMSGEWMPDGLAAESFSGSYAELG